jgi:hypothetical protein
MIIFAYNKTIYGVRLPYFGYKKQKCRIWESGRNKYVFIQGKVAQEDMRIMQRIQDLRAEVTEA